MKCTCGKGGGRRVKRTRIRELQPPAPPRRDGVTTDGLPWKQSRLTHKVKLLFYWWDVRPS